MTEFTGIAYEPHPVSPERKAELRAQGLRIIDAQFKPADEQAQYGVPYDFGDTSDAVKPQDEAPAKRGRKAKAE